jgi:hypothetical protein
MIESRGTKPRVFRASNVACVRTLALKTDEVAMFLHRIRARRCKDFSFGSGRHGADDKSPGRWNAIHFGCSTQQPVMQ